MKVIYLLLKIIVKIALWIYFPGTKIKHRERLRFSGPAIVVSNHQNTLMDVLVTAAPAREQFYFLANAGLFQSKFGNWFFNTFYCIPIERTLDTNGKPLNNESNFARVVQHLASGGTIYIAPEGTSWMKRHLHPLKTGTARMAFSAESKHDYRLNLKILPVGLNYSAPTEFRSRLFINVGEPLLVRDFQVLHAENAVQAVRRMTTVLEERMRTLMIDTRNDAEEALVQKLEEIWQNNQPLELEAQFNRTKKLIDQLHIWQSTDPEAYSQWEESVKVYFAMLKEFHLTDQAVANAHDRSLPLKLLGIVLGFPIFLYGYIHNFLPAWIPAATMSYLQRKVNLYIGYTSTVKFSLGIFLFPLFYWLQSEAVEAFFSTKISWWYLLSLPLGGLFAIEYQTFAQKALAQLRRRMLNGEAALRLNEKRAAIGQQLEKLAIFGIKTTA